MEQKREEQLLKDETGKYQDPCLDSVFMAAISEVYLAIQEAGYDPYDQLTGYAELKMTSILQDAGMPEKS